MTHAAARRRGALAAQDHVSEADEGTLVGLAHLDLAPVSTPASNHRCRNWMPYENDLGSFVARQRNVPIEQAWSGYRHDIQFIPLPHGHAP